MNVLLVEPAEVEDGHAVVAGRRARHVCEVLRAKPGDDVKIGVIRGGLGVASVIAAAPDRVDLAIGALSAPPPSPPVDLVLALPRPKVVPRVLQAVASMGVGRLDLVNAWRVDKTYFASHRLDPAELRAHLWLGCEQGAHTCLPEVAVHELLMPFLRESLASRTCERQLLVLHPGAREPVERVFAPSSGKPAVAIVGPEGGWIDRELEAFDRLGAARASLGTQVLRTEVAVVAALAQLALVRRLAG